MSDIYTVLKDAELFLLYLLPQVCEVLKLLNALLPASAGDQDVQMVLDKESFLANQPDLLQKFGNSILPILLQVASMKFSI